MANTLKKGDKLPNISLKDQNGELVNLHDYVGINPMVVYFYPKDDTPGCTAEACSFRDQYDVFESYGAKIFGISGDSPASHKRFATKHRINFTLLSDSKRTAEKSFGVPRNFLGLLPGRVTFILDHDGIIQYTFSSQLQAHKHVEKALKIIKGLKINN